VAIAERAKMMPDYIPEPDDDPRGGLLTAAVCVILMIAMGGICIALIVGVLK
jgi:hypothetical protein